MKATETVYDLIRIMRDINHEILHFPIDEDEVPYKYYKVLSDLYKDLLKYYDGKPDLLIKQLDAEVSERKLKVALADVLAEGQIYDNWYNPHSERLNSLFARESIERAADKEARSFFALRMHSAEEELKKAISDEDVWHQLARAYGSRCGGGKDENSFTEDDKEFIKPSLDEYKRHFQVDRVILAKMYEEFQMLRIPEKRIQACHDNISSIRALIDDKYWELLKDLECDVPADLSEHYESLKQVIITRNNPSETKISKTGKKAGRQKYRTYSNIRECLSGEQAYAALYDLKKWYYDHHSSLYGAFGYLVYKKFKSEGWFNPEGCSLDHWGELLIQEFEQECNFDNGGAISDASDRRDLQFEKQIDEVIAKYR